MNLNRSKRNETKRHKTLPALPKSPTYDENSAPAGENGRVEKGQC